MEVSTENAGWLGIGVPVLGFFIHTIWRSAGMAGVVRTNQERISAIEAEQKTQGGAIGAMASTLARIDERTAMMAHGVAPARERKGLGE